MIPTSNHNRVLARLFQAKVVYLLIPTSNHNKANIETLLIIVVYLLIPTSNHNSELSVFLYLIVVYLLIPTSNHNWGLWVSSSSALYIFWFLHQTTTYYPGLLVYPLLYIFWFLHQTTTDRQADVLSCRLYIFWFLHQTTTISVFGSILRGCISFDSYIKPQPVECIKDSHLSCISFDSYIKPQLLPSPHPVPAVVYLLIPTSNHNFFLHTFVA